MINTNELYDNYDILIVVGLPGSGKSTLFNDINGFKVFDDFIFQFSNKREGLALVNNEKICLIDPRMCDERIFKKYIDRLLIYEKDMCLIFFDNDPEKCIKNIKYRASKKDNDAMINTIINYSKIYDINKLVKIYNIDHKRLNVYHKINNQ